MKKFEVTLMKRWDIRAWNKYKDIREIRVALILTFIAGIVIGLAISRLL